MRRRLTIAVAAAAVCWAVLCTSVRSDAGQVTGSSAPTGAPIATVSSDDVAAVARELNCPVCQGYNLQDCPLLVCAQMRDVIRERLAQGESKDEILDAFVDEYGAQVLNAPPRRGFFLVAWILPVAVLAAAAGLLVVSLRRAAAREPKPEAAGGDGNGDGAESVAESQVTSPIAGEYAARLEQLARQRDGRAGAREDRASER